jgi:hypothetical protein
MKTETENGSLAVEAGERAYLPPKLEFIGDLVDVVRSGGGKASINAPDGPDTRKPPGQ